MHPAESVCYEIVLSVNMHCYKKNVVFKTPLPEMNGQEEQQKRVCTSLLVDVKQCSGIVCCYLDDHAKYDGLNIVESFENV